MIEPNTGNDHLDRMLMWFRLIQQMAKTYDHRDTDVRSSIGDADFNMGNVTNGYCIVSGDYCVTACCALGTAACHPWFNDHGLSPALTGVTGLKLDGLNVMLRGRAVAYSSAWLAHFFGIPKDLYDRIVDPERYDKVRLTPTDVLPRIREAIQQTFDVDPLSHPFLALSGRVD
jgi:hypothetical protein